MRGYQIVAWLSLRQLVFPAILDTGHSHNLTISSRHLTEWAGVDDLEPIGEIEVNGRPLTQYRADLQLHRNLPGTRQPWPETFSLNVDEGITVLPDATPGVPRLPLDGLRPISRGGPDARHRRQAPRGDAAYPGLVLSRPNRVGRQRSRKKIARFP